MRYLNRNNGRIRFYFRGMLLIDKAYRSREERNNLMATARTTFKFIPGAYFEISHYETGRYN